MEIRVILHTDNGDVVTTFHGVFSMPQAIELFESYVKDGKNVTMKTDYFKSLF